MHQIGLGDRQGAQARQVPEIRLRTDRHSYPTALYWGCVAKAICEIVLRPPYLPAPFKKGGPPAMKTATLTTVRYALVASRNGGTVSGCVPA